MRRLFLLAFVLIVCGDSWAGTYTRYPSTSSGSGSVTSVGETVPSFLSVTPATITSAGTFAITLSGTPLTATAGGTGVSSAFTGGSIVFVTPAGVYAQDNANLFYDTTNKRVGIGNTTPKTPVDVSRDASGNSFGVEINNNDYWMSIDKGTGNEQDFSAYGGMRWEWAPGGASALQFNDNGSNNNVQVIAVHSRDLNLLTNGSSNTTNVKISSSAAQTAPILEVQDIVPNTVFQINMNGHIKVKQAGNTTAVVKAAAGTGASCSLTNATDTAGNISLTTTAVAPGSGTQCIVTFASAYAVAPICVINPTSANSITQEIINGTYTTVTGGGLSIVYNSADAAGHANTWTYHCLETQ